MSNTDSVRSGNVVHGIGTGLHPRGNLDGHLGTASPHKWWEMHADTHFSPSSATVLRKQFFGHFLHGEHIAGTKRQPVELQVRHPGEKFIARTLSPGPTDADVFRALRLCTLENKEALLIGSSDPRRPRASQHKLDPSRSPPCRPPHTTTNSGHPSPAALSNPACCLLFSPHFDRR